jgi:D-3-phosphoglycerate dehydrogenase / 2-oxoglutarate reductase
MAADPRVLVTWLGFDPEDPRTGARLRSAGLCVDLVPKTGTRSPADMARLLDGAVAAIVSTDPIDRSVLQAASRLCVIARVGVGTDSIDLTAATEAGVVVTTTPGANREATADHALAMILASVRRVVEHDASVRRGEWRRGGDLTPWELHRTTVGLVGYGSIGQAVARRLGGFDVELLVCDPAAKPRRGLAVVELPELLRRADVVSLHAPLTDGTRRLIGRDELALMRPASVLVNTSRGGLVDEEALVRALKTGRMRAALDVFAHEPGVPHALADLPNVVLSPHIGGLSERSIASMTEQATSHVLAVLSGAPDAAAVANPAVLGRTRRAVA